MAKAVLEYSKEQKEYISAMRKAIEQSRKAIEQSKELKKSTGWVVAGFGGETYYCYVGEGNGYQGSCFYPMTNRAVVFDTEKEAQDHCYTGFRNGNGKGDLLKLYPVKASDYFAKVEDDLERQLGWAMDMWNKQVGRM